MISVNILDSPEHMDSFGIPPIIVGRLGILVIKKCLRSKQFFLLSTQTKWFKEQRA